MTRKEALARGLKWYFTGKPCSRGHITKRRTNNPKCEACAKIHNERWKLDNPEKVKETRRACHIKRRAIDLKQSRNWYKKNKSEHDRRNKAWRQKHPDRCRSFTKKWEKNNPEKQKARRIRLYYDGPLNPKGNRQWLSKARAIQRTVKRILGRRNRAAIS